MVRTRGSTPAATKQSRQPKALRDRTNTSERISKASHASMKSAKAPSTMPKTRESTDTTQQVIPAKKTHRHPRLTRKPIRTAADSVSTATEKRRISARRVEAAQRTSCSPISSNTSQMDGEAQQDGTQRVAESVYHSSNIPAATPSGLEHSILALKNFRRRPRQPSMLTMVKQRIASARSSLAGGGLDPALDDLDDSFELDDDFLPDAAGTPMHSSGPDTMGLRMAYDTSLGDKVEAGRSSGKRKRALRDDGHPEPSFDRILETQRKLVSQSDEDEELQSDQDDAPDRVSSTPQPEQEQGYQGQQEALKNPAAPSPNINSPVDMPTDLSQSSIYGPPVTQHTPPPQRKTRHTTRKAPMSTAVLQSLLPKRRKQVFDTYPVPAINLSADDDENDSGLEDMSNDTEDLSEVVRKRQKSTTKSSRRGVLQQTSPNIMSSKSPKDKASKTYGQRRTSARAKGTKVPSRKPDESAQEGLATMESISKSHELEAARKKFAEVDQWEMEFEVLTTEDSGASSQGWR